MKRVEATVARAKKRIGSENEGEGEGEKEDSGRVLKRETLLSYRLKYWGNDNHSQRHEASSEWRASKI